VIITELQNIKHVNIKQLKNMADINRYFSEHWKYWRGFTFYLGKDSILCLLTLGYRGIN